MMEEEQSYSVHPPCVLLIGNTNHFKKYADEHFLGYSKPSPQDCTILPFAYNLTAHTDIPVSSLTIKSAPTRSLKFSATNTIQSGVAYVLPEDLIPANSCSSLKKAVQLSHKYEGICDKNVRTMVKDALCDQNPYIEKVSARMPSLSTSDLAEMIQVAKAPASADSAMTAWLLCSEKGLHDLFSGQLLMDIQSKIYVEISARQFAQISLYKKNTLTIDCRKDTNRFVPFFNRAVSEAVYQDLFNTAYACGYDSFETFLKEFDNADNNNNSAAPSIQVNGHHIEEEPCIDHIDATAKHLSEGKLTYSLYSVISNSVAPAKSVLGLNSLHYDKWKINKETESSDHEAKKDTERKRDQWLSWEGEMAIFVKEMLLNRNSAFYVDQIKFKKPPVAKKNDNYSSKTPTFILHPDLKSVSDQIFVGANFSYHYITFLVNCLAYVVPHNKESAYCQTRKQKINEKEHVCDLCREQDGICVKDWIDTTFKMCKQGVSSLNACETTSPSVLLPLCKSSDMNFFSSIINGLPESTICEDYDVLLESISNLTSACLPTFADHDSVVRTVLSKLNSFVREMRGKIEHKMSQTKEAKVRFPTKYKMNCQGGAQSLWFQPIFSFLNKKSKALLCKYVCMNNAHQYITDKTAAIMNDSRPKLVKDMLHENILEDIFENNVCKHIQRNGYCPIYVKFSVLTNIQATHPTAGSSAAVISIPSAKICQQGYINCKSEVFKCRNESQNDSRDRHEQSQNDAVDKLQMVADTEWSDTSKLAAINYLQQYNDVFTFAAHVTHKSQPSVPEEVVRTKKKKQYYLELFCMKASQVKMLITISQAFQDAKMDRNTAVTGIKDLLSKYLMAQVVCELQCHDTFHNKILSYIQIASYSADRLIVNTRKSQFAHQFLRNIKSHYIRQHSNLLAVQQNFQNSPLAIFKLNLFSFKKEDNLHIVSSMNSDYSPNVAPIYNMLLFNKNKLFYSPLQKTICEGETDIFDQKKAETASKCCSVESIYSLLDDLYDFHENPDTLIACSDYQQLRGTLRKMGVSAAFHKAAHQFICDKLNIDCSVVTYSDDSDLEEDTFDVEF